MYRVEGVKLARRIQKRPSQRWNCDQSDVEERGDDRSLESWDEEWSSAWVEPRSGSCSCSCSWGVGSCEYADGIAIVGALALDV